MRHTDDDSQTMSYTTQGELKIKNKYCSSSLSSYDDDNSSTLSWATQHGKYVSLFEPEVPWHISKLKDINSNNNSTENIKNTEPFDDNKDNKSPLFNFNTTISSLLFLIILLMIIRYYIKS
ncbi:hypothetical protein Indivirus_1_123 [Indivirus ILV1]|uniref:Uncharacterized protein n=1 Tax=Indivirus ILV1 TaxID=1977633 RepID=A0A1V0SCQ0_9VIRU|nr:hypothetical protein Indivirus_1_123 [Indivirus ILV1]